jgi:hypothetical protein
MTAASTGLEGTKGRSTECVSKLGHVVASFSDPPEFEEAIGFVSEPPPELEDVDPFRFDEATEGSSTATCL